MFALIFVFEFALLFLLSRLLINSLGRLFFRATKSEKFTIILLSYLFLPGTIIHELSHLLTAGLLLVKTSEMTLSPRKEEEEVRLGSVAIQKTDIFRRAIIGVAPVLIGTAVIFGALFYLETNHQAGILAYAIVFLIIFEVGNTLFSSRKDLEGALELLLTLLVFATAIFVLNPKLIQNVLMLLQKQEVVNFFKNADLFLMAPLLINSIVILLVKVISGRK